jgi:hypothetical protein
MATLWEHEWIHHGLRKTNEAARIGWHFPSFFFLLPFCRFFFTVVVADIQDLKGLNLRLHLLALYFGNVAATLLVAVPPMSSLAFGITVKRIKTSRTTLGRAGSGTSRRVTLNVLPTNSEFRLPLKIFGHTAEAAVSFGCGYQLLS